MITIPRAGWVSVLLLCATGWLSAQKSTLNEDLIKADRQFDLYAYNLATLTYQQVLKDDPRNAHALARIGDCYFQLNNPEKSLEWYQKSIRQYNTEPDVHLRYGKALMQTGDYSGAKDEFLAYAETNESVGNHYAAACDYAVQNSKKESAWLAKNEALNTEYADFSPAFMAGRVVYNSARIDVISKTKSADSPSGSQNYLLVTQRNPESGLLQKPQILRSELQNTRNEGPASFSADGRKVAFCRNNFINGTRQIAESGINMSLYTADVDENGKWVNVKAFPYNGSNFATGFPTLSPDGTTLIFASTQPGGFGGWDIYVSNLRDGGWSTPRNLGTPLNSPGNEVTPFFDGSNLYFSSDWHNGFGGLDVFRAELGSEAVSNIYHLGAGVNTERDDYGFIFSSNDNVGYVTSTRLNGRGNEDIWKLSKKWNEDVTAAAAPAAKKTEEVIRPSEYSDYSDNTGLAKGTVSNDLHLLITDERGNILTNAEVDLSDCYGEKGYTDRDGHFAFSELTKTIDCQVFIRKNGFRDAEITLNKFGKQNIRIAMTPESRQRFNGRVFDVRSKAPVRGVLVQIQFQDGTNTVETTTDVDGSYSLFLDPGTTYLVNYSKYGYISQISKTYLGIDMSNIPSVLIEKEGEATAATGYVEYNNVTKPQEYSTEIAAATTTKTVMKKQAVVAQPKEVVATPATPKFNGYSIQLAAMPEEPSDTKLRSYESLTKDGNIYVKSENKLNKIRLGIFKTKAEADVVFKKIVASKTQKDAFIVEESGADDDLVLGAEPAARPVEHSTTTVPAASLDLVSKGVANPPVMYALQLGSFASEKTIPIGDYANLRGMGNLYSNTENGFTQVRLGVWHNYTEAEKGKEEAIKRGYPKALIVTEKGNDPDIQDFIVAPTVASTPVPLVKKEALTAATKSAPKPTEYSTTTPTTTTTEAVNPYFIRIAALSNPERFDGTPLADLGYIEKRKAEFSPGMTIILLAGFPTQTAADSALEKVLRRGYEDAYVMKEEKGKLVRKESK